MHTQPVHLLYSTYNQIIHSQLLQERFKLEQRLQYPSEVFTFKYPPVHQSINQSQPTQQTAFLKHIFSGTPPQTANIIQ